MVTRKTGKIGTSLLALFEPEEEGPDGCILILDETPADSVAEILVAETGLRVVQCQDFTSNALATLASDPKLPLAVLCHEGSVTSLFAALKKTPALPAGIVFLNPQPDALDPADLPKKLPSLAILSNQPQSKAARLGSALIKGGHLVHYEQCKSASGTTLADAINTMSDRYLISMTLAAMARRMWPH